MASGLVDLTLPPGSYAVMVEVDPAGSGDLFLDVMAFGPTADAWPTCL